MESLFPFLFSSCSKILIYSKILLVLYVQGRLLPGARTVSNADLNWPPRVHLYIKLARSLSNQAVPVWAEVGLRQLRWVGAD